MQNYKQWITVVPKSGILAVEKNNCTKFKITNITNVLAAPSGTDDVISISLHQRAGISTKKTRSSTASKSTYGTPASNGIAYSEGSSPYTNIKAVGLSVATKKLTLTLPANSPVLAVGTHVRLRDLNAAGKGASPYAFQTLAIVSKTSDTVYQLGTIIPASVTIAGGSTATVELLGFMIPSENAHPFLISKREGGFVTLTMSISEQLFQMNDVAKIENTYHVLVSGNHPMLNRKQEERVHFLVSSISSDGTGTLVIEDPDFLINEAYVVQDSDRIAVESGPYRPVRFPTDYVYFTGLKSGDKVEVETYCSQT